MRPPTTDEEAQLTARLTGMLPAGVIGAVRRIQAGDDKLLTAAERASLPPQLPGQRRASGAARALARELCATIGAPATDLVRSAAGVPLWPRRIIGSLAYDETFVAAVVGRSDVMRGIGLEIEHIEPADEDLLGLVAGPFELRSVRATRTTSSGCAPSRMRCTRRCMHATAASSSSTTSGSTSNPGWPPRTMGGA
jgi:4'-phosphopantetheinyl transferase EntD